MDSNIEIFLSQENGPDESAWKVESDCWLEALVLAFDNRSDSGLIANWFHAQVSQLEDCELSKSALVILNADGLQMGCLWGSELEKP